MGLEGMFEKFGETYSPGQILFCEWEPGDSFYLMHGGRVKISKLVGEVEKTLDIMQEGDIFGEMAILEHQPRNATATALTEVKLIRLRKENFETLLQSNPAMAIKLLKVFATRIYDAKRRLQILTLDDPAAKVADVFIMLAEKQGALKGDTRESIEFPITPEEVGNWCGLPSRLARKTVSDFTRGGKLEVYTDRIVVHNINEFLRLVSGKRRQKQV